MKIVVGSTTFRASFQDTNAEWKVIKKDGRNYLCEIVSDGYEGTKKIFMPQEIRNSMAWSDSITQSFNKRDEFYNNLQLGDIVHYQHSHNCWIRCSVVTDEGKKKLQQNELVGNWSEWELPKRINGEVNLGHAKYLGQLITPHTSCIYEANKTGIDPRKLPPINLNVPPPTEQETKIARLWQTLYDIQNASSTVKATPIHDLLSDPTPILQRIREILNELDKG